MDNQNNGTSAVSFKKQIIAVLSVAVAAVLLFSAWAIFFKKSDIVEVGDDFYKLSDAVSEKVAGIKNKTVITLVGYDANDEGFYMISKFIESITGSNKKLKRDEASGEKAVTVSCEDTGKTVTLPYGDFFKYLYDGTKYAFDGENLLINAVLEVNGLEKTDISLRALKGFDTDGDYVTSGEYPCPYLFKDTAKSDISILTMKNPKDDFSIIQQEGKFYFSDSFYATADEQQSAIFFTGCRVAIAKYGKMYLPEDRTWEEYGLDTEKFSTARYSIMTLPDSEGNYFLHTVYIGDKAASGEYYFARYIGGKLHGNGENEENAEIINNLAKDIIYFIDSSTVESELCVYETDLMKPELVNVMTATEALMSIDNVTIDHNKEGVHALIKNMSAFNKTDNLAAADSSALTKVISDKISAKDYSSYEGGWLKNLTVFAGFTSSDGKATSIDAALAKYAKNGEYEVTFGLLRDDASGAMLPKNIRISTSTDRVNWSDFEGSEITPEQSDKTVKKYSVKFKNDSEHIKFVRITFDVPQSTNTYVVFDEIRIFADGEDAQPTDSVSGIWRLITPSEYIPDGRNFAYLDMTNFNNFVQEFAALTGDKVVACGISKDGDPRNLNTEKLAKYGLDEPAKHFSYDFQGITTNLYVSEKQKGDFFYVYSTFIGEYQGTEIYYTTDIVAVLTLETAPWLDWEFFEFTDHYLLSMNIKEVNEITVSFDGNDHKFVTKLNDTLSDLEKVTYNGKELDVRSFKYLYRAMLVINMQDQYTPAEGEIPEEYLRIKIVSETRSPEIVFYRVSSSKCYFTVDGEGGYYARVTDVNDVRKKVLAYINGETITERV